MSKQIYIKILSFQVTNVDRTNSIPMACVKILTPQGTAIPSILSEGNASPAIVHFGLSPMESAYLQVSPLLHPFLFLKTVPKLMQLELVSLAHLTSSK